MSAEDGPTDREETDEETWRWVQRRLGRLEKYRPSAPSLDRVLPDGDSRGNTGGRFRFSPSPAIPIVAILIVLGATLLQPSLLPKGGAGAPQSPTADGSAALTSAPAPTPLVDGTLARCDAPAPSAPAFLPAEDSPIPLAGRHGVAGGPIQLQGLEIGLGQERVNAVTVLWPTVPPAGLPLRLALLSPAGTGVPEADQELYLVYSSVALGQVAATSILLDGGWILTEGLPQGRDADTVAWQLGQVGGSGHVKIVVVAGMRVALVHADPIDVAGNRHWGLYWSDGVRGMSIQAMGDPNLLLTYMRSLYCRG